MSRLIWTPAALQDLRRLNAFLKPKNPDAAKRAIAAIRSSMKVLTLHPQAGHIVREGDPHRREWLIAFGSAGYVALYRIAGIEIRILSVRHGREMSG